MTDGFFGLDDNGRPASSPSSSIKPGEGTLLQRKVIPVSEPSKSEDELEKEKEDATWGRTSSGIGQSSFNLSVRPGLEPFCTRTYGDEAE